MKGLNTWWFFALLSASFAALTAILAKVGIRGISSDLATAIRTVFILLIAWGIVFTRNESEGITSLSRTNWIFLGLSGVATGLSWIFYFKALQIGKVSQVAPVDKMSVAIAIVLSAIFLKEVITWKIALGALLIISGTLVLIF
jgi:transporter family protein